MNELHSIWTCQRIIKKASDNPDVINILKSSTFERMQTIVMEANPMEPLENHPVLFNMVNNIKFTHCLGNDWISVDDSPRFKAFQETGKKLLFISSDSATEEKITTILLTSPLRNLPVKPLEVHLKLWNQRPLAPTLSMPPHPLMAT